jgi:hypothetical protein
MFLSFISSVFFTSDEALSKSPRRKKRKDFALTLKEM